MTWGTNAGAKPRVGEGERDISAIWGTNAGAWVKAGADEAVEGRTRLKFTTEEDEVVVGSADEDIPVNEGTSNEVKVLPVDTCIGVEGEGEAPEWGMVRMVKHPQSIAQKKGPAQTKIISRS